MREGERNAVREGKTGAGGDGKRTEMIAGGGDPPCLGENGYSDIFYILVIISQLVNARCRICEFSE